MKNDIAVRKLWGPDVSYYKELEAFHEKHKGADAITYDNETGCPVSANYYFKPYTVYVDHYALMQKIAESQIKNLDEERGDE